MTLSAPRLLAAEDDLLAFSCGEVALDDWLKKRAYPNQVHGASRTYVVADDGHVVGYYSLASGALELKLAPGPVRRNMPDPIPMALLGRLAIDLRWQGRGLGTALLQDAVWRTEAAAGILGIRGLLVHAISEDAKAFYERNGFLTSGSQPMTLVLRLQRQT